MITWFLFLLHSRCRWCLSRKKVLHNYSNIYGYREEQKQKTNTTQLIVHYIIVYYIIVHYHSTHDTITFDSKWCCAGAQYIVLYVRTSWIARKIFNWGLRMCSIILNYKLLCTTKKKNCLFKVSVCVLSISFTIRVIVICQIQLELCTIVFLLCSCSHFLFVDAGVGLFSTMCNLKDLMNDVASKIPAKWRSVGIQLGLSSATLDSIQRENAIKPQACLDSFEQVFSTWEKRGPNPYTWEVIIGVLRTPAVGEVALADELDTRDI